VTSCSSSSASVATADVALMLAALGMVVGHRPLRRLFVRLVSPRAAGAGA
jgi:MYXO-CTERM domain-containing protein